MRELRLCALAAVLAAARGWVADLGGAGVWVLTSPTNSSVKPCRHTTVPGCVHTDLMGCSVIGNPLYRYNDRVDRWIAESDWNYTRPFSLTADQVASDSTELITEGIDTVATVWVNGEQVAAVDNMFVRSRAPLRKGLLRAGAENSITVLIRSAVNVARERAAAYPYPVYPTSKSPAEHGFGKVQFVRKEQASFGWDWGVALATLGIWKPISIAGDFGGRVTSVATIPVPASPTAEDIVGRAPIRPNERADWAWDASAVRRLAARGMPGRQPASINMTGADRSAASVVPAWAVAPGGWTVPVNACVALPHGQGEEDVTGTVRATLRLSATNFTRPACPGQPAPCPASGPAPTGLDDISGTAAVAGLPGSEPCVTVRLSVPAEAASRVPLWWPAPHGPQNLFAVDVVFQPDAQGRAASHASVRTGFRQLHVRQDRLPGGANGWTYHFEVNGAPVFAKGANWVPADALPTRESDTLLRRLLTSAAEASMNMVRVWGGGVYERDAFYDAADELGILLWQEAQLGDSLYPSGGTFLRSVAEEVRQQFSRLSPHPSLAIVVGSNEDEEFMANGAYGIKTNKTMYARYVSDYLSLTYGTIGSNYTAVDGSRYYSGSSPSDGVWTEMHGGVAPDPCNWTCGSTHYSNLFDSGLTADGPGAGPLTLDCWDPVWLPTSRYASEYGYFSWPSALGMEGVTEPGDRSFNASLLKYRNHHQDGNDRMLEEMRLHFDTPAAGPQAWRNTLWMTQVVHAVCIQKETEHYRRWRSRLDGPTSFGLTMGSTYWQLNDEWPTASWASLEYQGRWKALHYAAGRFYSPLALSLVMAPAGHEAGALWAATSKTPPPGGAMHLSLWADNDAAVPAEATAVVEIWGWNQSLADGPRLTLSTPLSLPPFASTAAALLNRSVASVAKQAGCALLPARAAAARHSNVASTSVGCRLTDACGVERFGLEARAPPQPAPGASDETAECFAVAFAADASGARLSPVVFQHLSWHMGDAPLRDPALRLSGFRAATAAGGRAAVEATLAADAPAAFAWLETAVPGRWSENLLTVTAANQTVTFFPRDGAVTDGLVGRLAASADVWSLRDMTRP